MAKVHEQQQRRMNSVLCAGVGLSSFEIFSSVSKVLCPTMCFCAWMTCCFSFLYISFAYVFVPKHMLIRRHRRGKGVISLPLLRSMQNIHPPFQERYSHMRPPNTLRKFSECFMIFILHDFPSPLLSLLASRLMNLVLGILQLYNIQISHLVMLLSFFLSLTISFWGGD